MTENWTGMPAIREEAIKVSKQNIVIRKRDPDVRINIPFPKQHE